MQDTAMTNGSRPHPMVAINGQSTGVGIMTLFPPERIQELVAELEDPFEFSEIKWRVTNTCKVGGPKGPRDRGQMLAYADPRAYTDRLNNLFAPSGWTRDYNVQTVQNFERKERGATERTITAKIVVTCRVTIHGFGTHTGLGEEWADNDNAGTAAEAQAFKRACSCFGLGRYLYDLEGQWVDLDEKKRPLETPVLPDWARPKRRASEHGCGANGADRSNGRQAKGDNCAARNGKGGLYRDELLGQVKTLCETVGFSLSRGVLQSVAKVEDPTKIRDMAKLSAAFEKLQDTARGIERLRAAVTKAGDQQYSALCRELNLASESIDDIPDRSVLRRLVETLEGDGTSAQAPQNSTNGEKQSGAASLSDLRGRLLHEANRVSRAKRRPLADVINQAAKGSFTFANLKTLGEADIGKVADALTELHRLEAAA
ncbi:MAG: hypothetical protein H7Y20_06000 [Bryobacteraceae bacterium]|nr:hypothetical protein [Bryobacteraceae bacterium]